MVKIDPLLLDHKNLLTHMLTHRYTTSVSVWDPAMR